MKKRLSTRGYVRTILLSILAACIIEAVVNADEVRAAFVAGRGIKQAATTALQGSTNGWLKLPQQLSKGIGHIYHVVFE